MPGPRSLRGEGWVYLVLGPFQAVGMPGHRPLQWVNQKEWYTRGGYRIHNNSVHALKFISTMT